LLFLVLLCANVLPLKAQPANFMVGHHTFGRPESWAWIDLSSTATISAKLIIKDPANQTADVVFVESKVNSGWASANETIGRWRKNFLEADEKQNQRREERQVGKVKLTFFSQEGTYKTVSFKGDIIPHPGYAQYGDINDDSN